jgi:SMP-30/Gluconolactonase/LRE-like region
MIPRYTAALWFSLTVALTVTSALAQLPASGVLSETDWPLFRAELARVENLLGTAPDKATVTYQMARTWAAGKQWPEAMEWLRRVAELRAGLDPARDSVFAELRGTKAFSEIERAVVEVTPAISHSTRAFTVAEGDLVPESMAFDAKRKRFYFGSMRKGKVVRCSEAGDCEDFASSLGEVLGLKVSNGGLWLLSNTESESSLIHFDLASGRLVRKYSVVGKGHEFNDLVIAPRGDVYLTDTRGGAIWQLTKNAGDLKKLEGRFQYANGITLSADARLLYVSTFPDGISVLDLKTNAARPLEHPDNLCLGSIDGLYFHRGALLAVQNGYMTPRVIRFIMTRQGHGIERFEVLERRNPLFDGVTTGVVAGGDFFYMANIQDDKKTDFNPIQVLKLRL